MANLETLSPAAPCQLLAKNSWDAPSRFREFLQQQELAGRIALALLTDRTPEEATSPIYVPTLRRIVSDLEEVQSTREWMTESRRLVADRLKGAGGASGTSTSHRGRQNGGSNVGRPSPRMSPTIMLRRSRQSAWSVLIEIPSFAPVVRAYPEFQSVLDRSRCKVAATGDTWHPRGWLLSGSRTKVLKHWPGSGTRLLVFEQLNPELEQLVNRETRLPSGPTWLCRIEGDGMGREIAGHVVRPGRRYILLSESAITARHSFLTPCKTDCQGIHAHLLSMPDSISFETTKALHQWGLQVAKTVRIWPAGLPAHRFDGEGHSEWLTTETPCFGIVHDHAVDTYSLRLDDGPETLLSASGIGIPVFFKIEMLPAGRHKLLVKARAPGAAGVPAAEGMVTLDIREPEPWIPGTTSHAGLAISLDSDNPSLDAFWENNIGVNVLGPAGHHVSREITLNAASGEPLLSELIGSFDLPVTRQDWSKRFAPFVREDRRTWTFLESGTTRSFLNAR